MADWKRVEELFHAAAAIPAGPAREGYLQHETAGDAELLAEVRSLLENDQYPDSGTGDPEFAVAIGQVAVSLRRGSPEETQRERIGPYRIERQLGEGGMGSVYLAVRDDDQYRKKVAVKLIRRGLDAPWLVERFRHERQILASLEHPHIARLLDGGNTEDGLPYIVMEFVEGEPITRYCEHRNLPVNDRLQLFRQVCEAVSYAHRNLVIHRDLKPANILATADGGPRLLDFGTAKLTGEEAGGPAHTVAPMMTPDYASPEQIRGEPVTTASDVYSLGVILYELLAGRKPYETQGNAALALERVITGSEPQPPSSLRLHRELKGDLDRIVLMAMRREPERRYASVEQLAEDIRRYLQGLPVIARQDSFSYRAGKFVRRNKLAVGALAAGLLTLLAGAGVAIWQAREARLAARKAEQRFADVRSLANTFLLDMQEKLRPIQGTLAVRKTMVDTALQHLDKLSRESEGDPSLQFELATAYDRVSRILGNPAEVNLGNTRLALESARRGVVLFDQALAAGPARREWLTGASGAHRRLAELLNLSNVQQSKVEAAKAVELGRKSIATGEPGKDDLDNLRAALNRLSEYQRMAGDMDASLATAGECLQVSQRIAQTSAGPYGDRALALSYNLIATIRHFRHEEREALEAFLKTSELREGLVANGTATLSDRRNLALTYSEIAMVQQALHPNNLAPAITSAESALRLLKTLGGDAGDTRAAADQSAVLVRLAGLVRKSDPKRARTLLEQAIELRKTLPSDPSQMNRQANSHNDLADLLIDSGDLAAAVRYLDNAVDLNQAVLAKDAKRPAFVSVAFRTRILQSTVFRKRKDWTKAESAARAAVALATERMQVADAHLALGRSLQGAGNRRSAAEAYKASIRAWDVASKLTAAETRRKEEAQSLLAALPQ